jgi:hypothetical protein
VLSTDAVVVKSDSLKIKLVMDDYQNGNMLGQVTYLPANGPIRLLPGNSVKIELMP